MPIGNGTNGNDVNGNDVNGNTAITIGFRRKATVGTEPAERKTAVGAIQQPFVILRRQNCHLEFMRQMVRPAGIEPATPAFGGQYSIH